MPGLNTQSYYAAQSSALNVYEANLPDYAPAMYRTPQALHSQLGPQNSGVRMGAAYVNRIPRMNGIQGVYGHGAINMEPTLKGPTATDNGAVMSQLFQPFLNQIHYYTRNLNWYIAYPNAGAVFWGSNPIRKEYFSMRVPVVRTTTSGGPGPVTTRMQPKPRFTSVQRLRRAISVVNYYATQSQSTPNVNSGNAASPIGRVPNGR